MPGKMAMRVFAPALSAVVLLGGISVVSFASKGVAAGGNQTAMQRSTVVEKQAGQSAVCLDDQTHVDRHS